MQSDVLAVSVVMPLYNKETDIQRAVQSVLSQTVSDFELIVVNDGSTDCGPEVVRRFNDPRIRIVDQENAGVSAARNRGIEEARADLIAFLDADDEWMPDFLETILRLRNKFPSCKVFATRYLFSSPDGRQRSAIIRGLPDGFLEGVLANYFDVASMSDPPLCASALAVEKKAIAGLGGFPTEIVSGEDLLTWARLAIQYEIAYHKEPKAYFWEPANVSDRPGRVPRIPDFVSDELKKFSNNADPAKCMGLKRYISLWHKMRANIYIQLGEGRKAREELQKAADYYGWGLKIFILSVISRIPRGSSEKVLKFLMHLKNNWNVVL